MTGRMKHIAVLGGSRFIGHAIVEALIQKGCRITTVNRGVTSVSYSGPVTRVIADRQDGKGYAHALAKTRVDCVVDVTAYQPDETRLVCDVFRNRMTRLIHISTLSVYRQPYVCPVSEDAALENDACNAYGYDKALCEALILSESKVCLPWTILRLPAVFGPGDPFSREDYLYRKILDGKTIFVPPRPYQCQNIFVADVARAVCAVLESDQAAGRVYNIGGRPFTLEAYVDLLASFAGQVPQMIRADSRVLEQAGTDLRKIPYFYEGDLVLDTRRIFNEIGFLPAWDIQKALARTLKDHSIATAGDRL